MGGSSTSTKHETSSNTINPLQMQQYQDNYNTAKGTADSLQPFTGPLTAGFNQNQTNAQGILSGIATDPRYGQINQDAMSQIKGVMGSIPGGQINAQRVNANPYTASTYDAAQLAGTDLSPYMNPFQKDVIDASIAQNGYARDQQGVKDQAAATAAHAFGGTRQAVQAAETSGAYDRNNQQNIAALNSANFGQAREGAMADIGARNSASVFNAGARNSASQFNANQDLGAQQFNSGQDFNAQQNSFGNSLAALGLKMNAAGQLVSIGQADLQRATQQGGILSAVGDAQQQQEQSAYGNEYNRWLGNNQLSLAQQQLLNQALGIIPIEQTNTTDGTQTTKSNPGIGGVLGAVGSLGLAAATGGTSLGLTGALGGLGGLFGSKLAGQSSGPSMGWT